MIGYEWTVYAGNSNDPIVACGITDDSAQAATLVEFVMRTVSRAAWGMLARVTVSTENIRQHPIDTWPPAGKIQVCKRDRSGGFTWLPYGAVPPETHEKYPRDTRHQRASNSAPRNTE
jgi:hypothetical protein